MEKEFKISERKHDLLISAVESYIENASPITSEKVHNTLFKNLSIGRDGISKTTTHK